MLLALIKAYAVVAATFFAGHLLYQVVANVIIKPIILNTIYPQHVLVQPDTVIDQTFRVIAGFLEHAATWFASQLSRFAITLISAIKVGGIAFIKTLKKLASSELIRVEMGGWFSRNEVCLLYTSPSPRDRG